MNNDLLIEGPIYKGMFKFTIPIFLGLVLQMLYNIIDSIILGNFVGTNAFAAVSSTNAMNSLIISFFQGLSQGAGIIIAGFYGQKKYKELKISIHTAISFGIISGIIVTIIGITTTPFILKLMRTPALVIDDAIIYTKIFYIGGIFLVVVNMCISIVQAMGDSKHPLYYLIISTLTNISLDLIFIGIFHMGVVGAALATLIATMLSCILTFRLLLKLDKTYRFHVKELCLDKYCVKEFLKNGVPAGISTTIISLANTVVQANINVFGRYAMAGVAACNAIEGLVFIPITSFSNALTTFVSQNLGVGNKDRTRKGAKLGIICSILIAEIIGIFSILFARELIGLFTKDVNSIKYGIDKMRICSMFYIFLAYTHTISATLRGARRPIVPMLSMIIIWCVIRVSFLTITEYYWHNILFLYWVYPLTWFLSSLFLTIYVIKVKPISSY